MGGINSVMKEFKAFILEGNIIDMAVGVVIDDAFSRTVTSLVNDILMPLLDALTGDTSFNTLKYVVHPAAMINRVGVTEAAILHGSSLQDILDFFIIGVCMFFMTRATAVINSRLHHEEEAKGEASASAGPTQEESLAGIRNLLKEHGDIA